MPDQVAPVAGHADRGQAPIWPYLLLALVVIVLDQATKLAILARFDLGERVSVIPGFFDLTLLFNRGAAFSFLAAHDGWQRWFFIGIAIAASIFIVHLLRTHRSQRLFSFALALILGGAVGNVVDRLAYGQVVDFLLFHQGNWYFPAFNVADSAITVGAATLIIDELLRMKRVRVTT
ncbi:MAG: lipoprotein signal peptidase [Burkholderiaceae bacterium]|nr:lipoprotein signal peptidase [Burkholderiaceae bacterium]